MALIPRVYLKAQNLLNVQNVSQACNDYCLKGLSVYVLLSLAAAVLIVLILLTESFVSRSLIATKQTQNFLVLISISYLC
jgi:hypothetical protein